MEIWTPVQKAGKKVLLKALKYKAFPPCSFLSICCAVFFICYFMSLEVQKNKKFKLALYLPFVFTSCNISFNETIRALHLYAESLKPHNSYFPAVLWKVLSVGQSRYTQARLRKLEGGREGPQA